MANVDNVEFSNDKKQDVSSILSTIEKKSKKKLDLYRWQVAGHLPIFYYDGYG